MEIHQYLKDGKDAEGQPARSYAWKFYFQADYGEDVEAVAYNALSDAWVSLGRERAGLGSLNNG